MTIIVEQHNLKIQWQDYLVFGTMLAISAVIGLFFMYRDRKQKKSDDVDNYLLAGRMISSPFPPAMSLTASFMSALTVLGTPLEFYMYGSMFAWCGLAFFLVAMMVAHFFLPVIYNLRISTSYEYLRIRFECKHLETATSIIYLATTLLYCGIVVYAPALALTIDGNQCLVGSYRNRSLMHLLHKLGWTKSRSLD